MIAQQNLLAMQAIDFLRNRELRDEG